MKILIDMNLPPRWANFLADHGTSATHWSFEGDMKAPDSEILRRAREWNCVFGVLMSMTQKTGPSVIQVRTQDVTPEAIGSLVLTANRETSLDEG